MKKKKPVVHKPIVMYLGWDNWSMEFVLRIDDVKYVYPKISEPIHRGFLKILRGKKPRSLLPILNKPIYNDHRKYCLITGKEIPVVKKPIQLTLF